MNEVICLVNIAYSISFLLQWNYITLADILWLLKDADALWLHPWIEQHSDGEHASLLKPTSYCEEQLMRYIDGYAV